MPLDFLLTGAFPHISKTGWRLWQLLRQNSGWGWVSQSSPSSEIFSPLQHFSGSFGFTPKSSRELMEWRPRAGMQSRGFLNILNIPESRIWPAVLTVSGLTYVSGGQYQRFFSCFLLRQTPSRTAVQGQGCDWIINDAPLSRPTRYIILLTTLKIFGGHSVASLPETNSKI